MSRTQQEAQYARRMTRGTLLTHLYRLQDMGLNDPGSPRTATRGAIMSLGATGMLPPDDLLCTALQWLEGGEYVKVDWGMDDHTIFESVTITQKGINLYEAKNARDLEPGILLQPRR